MLECETTDAGEPLSISTVAHASNRIPRSIVAVTVDTTGRRRWFSIRCGRVFSHVTCSHIGVGLWGGGGRSAGLCFHSPTFSECLPRRRLFIQTFQGHIETTLLQMLHAGSIAHPYRAVIRLHLGAFLTCPVKSVSSRIERIYEAGLPSPGSDGSEPVILHFHEIKLATTPADF